MANMTGQVEGAAQRDSSTEEGNPPQYWIPTWSVEALRLIAAAIALDKEGGDIKRAARRCGESASGIAAITARGRVDITGELKSRWNLPFGRNLLFAVVKQEADRRGAKIVLRCSSDEALVRAIHEVMASLPSDPAPALVAPPVPVPVPQEPPSPAPVVVPSAIAPQIGSSNGHGGSSATPSRNTGEAEMPEDEEPVPAATSNGTGEAKDVFQPYSDRNQEDIRNRALKRFGIPTFRVGELIKLAVRRATSLNPGSEQAAARLLGWTPDHLRKKLREDPRLGRELRQDPNLPTLDLLELSRRAYLAARVVYQDDVHGIARLVHKDVVWVVEVPTTHTHVLERLSAL